LGYALTLPFGAKLMGKLGIKVSLLVSIFLRIPYFAAFYFFPSNPILYTIIALISIIFVRGLFWVPFHTETAKLSDKKTRGKQLSILFSVSSLLSIVAPIIAGVILEKWSFAIVTILAATFGLLSIWPFWKISASKEEFSWNFLETWKYFFHPFNRKMVVAYMSDGLIGAVNGIFWPLFIFTILNDQYRAMGLLTAAIVLVGIILRLFIGNLLDHWHKHKMVRIGTFLNATAWFFKIIVVSALHVFLVSIYHAFALIILRTSLDTLVYEKEADRGHYIDEYTVIREMSIHIGKVVGLIGLAILLLFLPMQISFAIAGIATLFINLLH